MARDKGGQRGRTAPPGGWPTGRKVPTIAQPAVDVAKVPRALHIDQEDVTKRRLVWRFGDHDDDGEYSLAAIDSATLGELIKKLRSFESMTLGELFAVGSEHGKTYAVETLSAPIQKRLTELGRDDETEVARLRCGGKPRLYGFLRENVFHVLWWDPEHLVYPSQKRNT